MARFEEENLAFDFGAAWHDTVIQFDKHRDYQNAKKLDGTKGVDFLGICRDELYLIEVKDFRGYRIQNKPRLSNGELAIEVGQKIKDTIACIVGAYRTSSNPDQWQPFIPLLLNQQRKIRIILWLEQDALPQHTHGEGFASNVLGNELKRRLKWMGVRVDVQNLSQSGIANLDLQVTNLPTGTT